MVTNRWSQLVSTHANDYLAIQFSNILFCCASEDPAEQVFDDNMNNVNTFLQRIAKFEMTTNIENVDMWRIKDMAF